MFDLENAIAGWRQKMNAGGIHAGEVLEELEGHLREDIERRRRQGESVETAFRTATQSLGEAKDLRGEFERSHAGVATLFERLKSMALLLAGIPTTAAVTAGGPASVSLLEPRWATYARTLFFCAPALLLWTFSALFILPKVKQLSLVAGFDGFKLVSWMEWVTFHGVAFGFGLVGSLCLLEWRATRWPRYRRAALGTGAFVLNSLVMVTITLMAISVILTAVHARH